MSVVPFASSSQRQLWMPENALKDRQEFKVILGKWDSEFFSEDFETLTSARPVESVRLGNRINRGILIKVIFPRTPSQDFIHVFLSFSLFSSLPKEFRSIGTNSASIRHRTDGPPFENVDWSHLCFTSPRKLHIKWFRGANIEYSRTDNLCSGSRNYATLSLLAGFAGKTFIVRVDR